MKNINKVITIILYFIFVMGLTGCSDKKENVNIKGLLQDYTSNYNSLDGKIIDEYYSPKDYKFLDSNIDGIIFSSINSFDNNNDNAMIYSIKDNKLTIEYLKLKENKLINQSTPVIDNFLPEMDEYTINVYYVKLNNQSKIFLELIGESSILSDGKLYSLTPLSISNDKIVVEEKIKLEANALQEEDIKEYIEKVKKTGLSVNTIEKSILSQNKDAIRLFMIERKHIDNFDVNNYINSKEEKIKYGTTLIGSYNTLTEDKNKEE